MAINGKTLPGVLRDQLKLTETELRITLRLVAWERISREQACATAECTRGSLNAIVASLRRKLAKEGIKLMTLRDFGWSLPSKWQTKLIDMIKVK